MSVEKRRRDMGLRKKEQRKKERLRLSTVIY